MQYFSQFPMTTFELDGVRSVVRDIFRRAGFVSEYRPYADLFEPYVIKDGDTPESISIKFYDTVNYYWIILLFNEIHNIHTDWPMQQLQLEAYCQNKYGKTPQEEYKMFYVSHYEIDGNVVGEKKEFVYDMEWFPPENPYPSEIKCIPMTFFDMENNINDSKRELKILRPELISDFITQFRAAING